MGTPQSFPEIHEVVREIRGRFRQSMTAPPPAAEGVEAGPAVPPALDLARVREAVQRVRLSETLAGQIPPRPAGLRARIGAALVRLVGRMLFWYTPNILQYHGAVAQAMEEQMAFLEELSRTERELLRSLERLKQELRSLEERLAGPAGD